MAHYFFKVDESAIFDYSRALMFILISTVLVIFKRTIEKSQNKISNLNLILKGIKDVNMIVHTEKTRDGLLKNTCKVLVENGSYTGIWIILWDANWEIANWAESGFNDAFQNFLARLDSKELPYCCKKAFNREGIVLVKDIVNTCHGCQLLYNFTDMGAMTSRIEYDNNLSGIINVIVPRDLVYEEEAQDLLMEIRGIIEYALQSTKLQKEHNALVENLRVSEERFRIIIENAPFGYYRIGTDRKWQYVNKVWEEMYGFSSESIVGKDIDSFLAKNEREKIIDNFEKAVSGISFSGELSIQKKNKTMKYHLFNCQPVYSSGYIIAVEGFLNDVTETRKLQYEIMKVTEKERQRIGQDLHDGLGQNLTAATFLIEAIKDKTGSNVPDLERIHEIIIDSIIQSRNISRMLSPVDMDKDGFIAAIERMAAATEKIFNIKCVINSEGNFIIKDNETATHLYYIAREAVNNSVKHGYSKNITVQLLEGNSGGSLIIKDDGIGSDEPFTDNGIGLSIMEYRSRIIDAEFFAGNNPLGGFIVKVLL